MNIAKKSLMRVGHFFVVALMGLPICGCATNGTGDTASCCDSGGAACAVPTAAAATLPTAASPSTKPASMPATAPSTQAAWQDLFDGKTLKNWTAGDFAAHGELEVQNGVLLLPAGETLTAANYTGDGMPKMDYEIEVVARKTSGSDFFSSITFPVADSHITLVIGGWGGAVVGLSCLDDLDASHNESTTYQKFEKNKWYTIRARITAQKLEWWIDDKPIMDVETKGKKIGVRSGMEPGKPFSVSTYMTTAEIKSVRIRKI